LTGKEIQMTRSAKCGLLISIAIGVSAGVHAQQAAEKPKLSIGDRWEFTQSAADGKKTPWSREVVEIPSGGQLRVRLGGGSIADYDDAMNFMPEGKAEYLRLLVKYPLKVGDEWTFSRKFANPSVGEQGKAKVVAFEPLTVPAGTFQCFRVEADASLTNKAYKENRTWVRWYCPDVKWIAKEVLETRTTSRESGSSSTVETSELVKFTPGK
jgi:hypothetical protein